MLWTIATFFMFTGLVGVIAYYRTRNDRLDTSDSYFLAGRGLTGWVIGSSMLLTNLSAEHLVGLNGQAYRSNLSSMAWETTPVFAIVVMALFFMPRYLRGAFTTLPEFFEDRYDDKTRRLMSVLMLLGYITITLPAGCLYPGAVALNRMFDIETMLGVTPGVALWISVWFIGLVGAAYAVFGGLKAVAVSDSVNGVGLLIGGLMVPFFALFALGKGSVADGIARILQDSPDKLNAIGAATDPVPFGTIFTGMVLANLFYWGTNQAIIQRCLGAKSLAEAQKGVLIAGFFKLFVPLIMMLPGIVAFHMFPNLSDPDHAYPLLVAQVFPTLLVGFFTAVLFGAVLSTYNSILNSAATMVCLDIYKPLFNPMINDAALIRKGKCIATTIAFITMCVAPFVAFAPEGLFQFIRRSTGFYNIPMITLVLVGFFTTRTSGLAARVSVLFYLAAYTLFVFVLGEPIHFIHIMGILFLMMVALLLTISFFKPRAYPYQMRQDRQTVDLTPWKFGPSFATLLLTLLVFVYLLCSPLGLAAEHGPGALFYTSSVCLGCVALGMIAWLSMRDPKKHHDARMDRGENR